MNEAAAVAKPPATQAHPAPIEREKAKGERFNATVHGLRGMAAFMVFLAHVIGGVGEHIYAGDLGYQQMVEAPWNFGRWGVWLFFVISGYVILPSVLRYAPREFALRRFLRLYPLFFAFTLLFIAVNAATNLFPDLRDPLTIGAALLLVNLLTHTEQLTPNAWSLSYEVLFYAMTCLIVHFALRRRSMPMTAILAIAAVGIIAHYPAMAFFVAGIGVRLLDDRKIRAPAPLLIPLELVAAAGCLVFASLRHYTFETDELHLPGLYGIFVFTVLYFWLAIQPGSLSARILDNPAHFYLGTVSYSLYLAHPYTYFAARHVFVRFGLFGDHWPLSVGIFLLVTIPATLLFTQIVYVAFERFPYRWFFRERIYHR